MLTVIETIDPSVSSTLALMLQFKNYTSPGHQHSAARCGAELVRL